jgi:hypothetical protein
MIFLRRTLPVLICFVVGVLALATFYVPAPLAKDALLHGSNTGKIVIGFSYVIGLYSLGHLHWSRIRRKQPGWGYSGLVFVGLIPMLFFGLAGEAEKFVELVFRTGEVGIADRLQVYGEDQLGSKYAWLITNVFNPAQATMFSLLGFFIASAAYRTFRARTAESAFLLIAAVIVIFGRVPLGGLIWDQIPAWADWIMGYPNLAAKRGILIGVSLGIVGTALRVIFGIERAYVGGE